MIARLTRNWWVFLVRGLLAILLSVLIVAGHDLALKIIVILIGAYALVDGVVILFTGLVSPSLFAGWWAMLLAGVAGIALGVMTFIWPETAVVALILVIGAWAVVRGALEIAAAVYFRRILDREWALITTGSLSILLGILLAVFPWAGALAMVLLIAAFGLVMGVRWIILAFRIHGLRNQFKEL